MMVPIQINDDEVNGFLQAKDRQLASMRNEIGELQQDVEGIRLDWAQDYTVENGEQRTPSGVIIEKFNLSYGSALQRRPLQHENQTAVATPPHMLPQWVSSNIFNHHHHQHQILIHRHKHRLPQAYHQGRQGFHRLMVRLIHPMGLHQLYPVLGCSP